MDNIKHCLNMINDSKKRKSYFLARECFLSKLLHSREPATSFKETWTLSTQWVLWRWLFTGHLIWGLIIFVKRVCLCSVHFSFFCQQNLITFLLLQKNMLFVLFLIALSCLINADTRKEDHEASQRLIQFGLNAKFYNALKKDKDPDTGIWIVKIKI